MRRRGQKSPIPRDEREISRKTIAQGMSDRLRCPVRSCALSFYPCTRDRGCSAHPAFPAPSLWRDNDMQTSGAMRRENAGVWLLFEIRIEMSPRHCERSEAIHPILTSLVRCGLLSFARNDAVGCLTIESGLTVSQRVVPANAGTHNPRRLLGDATAQQGDLHHPHYRRHGVWVPAFAGTTLRDHQSGAALSPRELVSLETSEATTMTTAIRAITRVQMALISGFTPSRTSE